jgi:group I intron endonuclease
MTIGVYLITNKIDGRVYVGQSNNVERRFREHCGYGGKSTPVTADINRLGVDNFSVDVIKKFDTVQRDEMIETEMFFIRAMKATDPIIGYNQIEGHMFGDDNPNYGNQWEHSAKTRMSDLKKTQHADGMYGDEWREKIGLASTEFWANNPDVKNQMAVNVRKTKQEKWLFHQMNEDGETIRTWDSMEEITTANPTWKWQNIYSVCNGYKKRIYGFKWKKVLKNGRH